MGESLGSATRQNTRLLSLDLAGNHISDSGASHLADGLRLNRTLLVLNLAGNGIGDVGAKKLANVLSTFELTHEEVVERRRLQYARRQRTPSRQLSSSKLMTLRRVSSTLSSTSSQHRARKRGASPADHGKTVKATSKPGKSPKQTLLDDGKPKKEKSGTKLKKPGQSGRGVGTVDSSHSVDQSLPTDGRNNPLLSIIVLRQSTTAQPTTLVVGNRTLISLNLSRNEIGQAGMSALLDAVLPLSRDPVPSDATMPGLLRITTNNNRVPGAAAAGLSRRRRSTAADTATDRHSHGIDATVRYLHAAIAPRDPLIRTQTPASTTTKPTLSSTYINVIEA